jgi:SulP family sulfate permease
MHTSAVLPRQKTLLQSSILRELAAGFTVAFVALPLCIAAGVLVYSELGPEYAARGAVAGLLCAVSAGITAAIFRQSSFVTTIPTTPIALVQASSVAALAKISHGDASTVIALLPILVLLVGALQIVFAATGVSRIIKFTPYPVLAGFVSGIGLLMMLRQLPILAGEPALSEVVSDIVALQWPHPFIAVFGLGLFIGMLLLEKYLPRAPNLLVGLIFGFLVFHAMRSWFPEVDLGGTVGRIKLSSIWAVSQIDFHAAESLLSNVGTLKILVFGSLTLAALGTLDTFFALRTAQQLADTVITPRRDVMGQGVANLVSAITGGLVVSTSINLSTANYRAGGRSRISTIAIGGVLLLTTLLIPGLIFSLPVVVLAAILLVASLRLFDRWTFQVMRDALAREKSDRARARLNLLVVAAVLSATVIGEPVVGAGVGVALSCLIFIAQMSRPIIAQQFTSANLHSKRVRSQQQADFLRSQGARISILELQGVLFFGNTDDLAVQLRELQKSANIVILDMRRVTEVDTSGITVLQQTAQRFAGGGKTLVACGASPKFSNVVKSALGKSNHVMFSDRDTALEWAEEKIIRGEVHAQTLIELPLHEADLTRHMTGDEIGVLTNCLQVVEYAAHSVLCRAGDPADRMWILKRGSVSVRVTVANMERRLASLGPGCAVGEMGMLENMPRSAHVIADEDVEAYLLTREDFDMILKDHPRIAQAMLVNIAQQLARRLRDTSEELRTLTH